MSQSFGSSPNTVTFILVCLEAVFPVLDAANAPGEVNHIVLTCHAYPEDGIELVLHAGNIPVSLHVLLSQLQFLDLFFSGICISRIKLFTFILVIFSKFLKDNDLQKPI